MSMCYACGKTVDYQLSMRDLCKNCLLKRKEKKNLESLHRSANSVITFEFYNSTDPECSNEFG